ncbi:MAG: NifU family protein [Methylocella sp.]
MTEDERLRLISSTIEALRPSVQNDGGDLELVAVRGSRVEVRLSGQCLSCALAVQTLGGVRRKLMDVLDTPVLVVPCQS